MKIEIVQGPVHHITGRPGQCEECEKEALGEGARQDAQEGDRVSLSDSTRSGFREPVQPEQTRNGEPNPDSNQKERSNLQAGPRSDLKLTAEERRVLDQLRSRDREVRAHEQAHKAAAGPYAKGPPSFEYQTGPDGKRYAVGGEVKIDSSPVPGNPRATLIKAQTIKRAANAPRNPSAQDRQVAAQAAQMEAQARRELQEQKTETRENESATGSANAVSTTSPTSEPAPGPSETGNTENENFSGTGPPREDAGIINHEPNNVGKSVPEKGSLVNLFS